MKIFQNTTDTINGTTLLRFSHAFESGGGVENYLKDCNNILLQRNDMTIIQIFYSDKVTDFTECQQFTGKGKLINIAVPYCENYRIGSSVKSNYGYSVSKLFLSFLKNYIFNNPALQHCFKNLKRRYSKKIPGLNTREAYKLFKHIFTNYKIDLISLHCLGADDTSQIINFATTRKIPFFYLNHYSNKKFNDFFIQEQLHFASGIAGVSDCGVPEFLHKQFVSLYDGIDTSIFSKENASPIPLPPSKDPIVFLPARICEGKGHLDVIKAAILLKKEQIPVHILFAGRNDSSQFNAHLHTLIEQNQLSDCVTFYDQCNIDYIRNMYALSSIVVLPSKSEGFSRILLEAQSMSIPVVAYNAGGASQSLLPGKSGYLCKPGDIHELKNSIKKILTDPSLRHSFGRTGRNFILNNFTLEHLACRHELYYQSILKKFGSHLSFFHVASSLQE